MADPEQTAKNVLAILGQIDDRLSSISNKVGQISSSGASFGGSLGGGGGGGNGSASGAAGGSGGRGGGLGLAPLPGGSTPSGGGGSGQNNLGLGRVAAQAAGSALASSLSRFGTDRVSSAISNQVLANSFSIRSGAPTSQFLFGKQLFQGLNGYSSQDLGEAASIIGQQAVPNSALYKQIAQSVGQESLRQPGISQASVAQFGLQTRTPQTYNTLRLYGVQALNGNGTGKNAQQLAQSILQRAGPSVKGNDQALTSALQPGSVLDNLLNNSGITGDLRTQVENELHAQTTGRTGQLSQTADSSTKKRATAAANRNLRTDQGVAEGASTINDAATKISKAGDTLLGASEKAADAIGRAIGGSQQSGSKLGALALIAAFGGNGSSGAGAGASLGNSSSGLSGGTPYVPTTPSPQGGPGAAPRGLGGSSKMGGGAGGKSGAKTSLRHIWPVGPGGITQAFGAGAEHHPGVDFGRNAGTPIHSAADGTVLYAGPAQGFGNNFVVVFHPAENKVTRYGHGSAKYVKAGDKVNAGTVIAAVGTEGQSTGNHLHMELANGQAINGGYLNNLDPVPWLGGAGTSTATTTNDPTANTSSSSASGNVSGPSAAAGQNGFGLIGLNEGRTSSLLLSGGAAPAGVSSSGTSSSGSNSSTAGGGLSGTSPGTWSSKLPGAGQKFAGLFQAAGKKYGINPALLAAVADTESSFNPSVVNSIGAAGLFQFIPSTAKGFGINALDPGQATNAAASYIRQLLQQNNGNLEGALNGYSGGGGAHYFNTVEGFFKQFGGGPVTGSFDKGSWELDRDQEAMVHKGEMIIPKGPADQLRQRMRGGGSGTGVQIYVSLQNASNSEAMRLVQVVKSQLESDDIMSSLGSS